MTFLNPFVLFGLAAAAIPILIHLLNKRKLRTIEFSTLTFLKELQKNKMRKITIRQWFLLLLRTLIIVFLVLAFSRPALKGNFGTIGSHAKTSLLIILDNTASMNLHNEKGKYLDQAKEQALQVVSLMQENDDAVILRLSDLPALTMESASHDKQKLQETILETSVSVVHRTIEDALRAGSTIIGQSKNFNKEVYIFSDGQTTTLRSEKNTKSEVLFEPNVKFFFTELNTIQQNNTGVERVSIPPTLLQQYKPVTVSAVIKNYGHSRVANRLATLLVGSTRVMQKSVSLEGGESGTIDFTFTPTQTGFITGVIELEDDEFEIDNREYFSVYIPEQISITLVSSDDAHTRYIATALDIANTSSSSSFIAINKILAAQISTTLIRASDIVVLSGVKIISEQQQQALKNYVSTGGSVVFFPSSDSTFSSYTYLNNFDIQKFSTVTSQSPGSQFEKIDLDFPIFSGMFDPAQSNKQNIESPDVVRSLSPSITRTIQSIITLSNGTSFIWLAEYGSGKIVGFSVPATTNWSNFPLKGIFVPLINQTMIYLASQVQLEANRKTYNAGEHIEFTSAQIKKVKYGVQTNLRLIDPENRFSPINSFSKISGDGVTQTIFTGEILGTLGHHFVLADRDTVFTLSVNLKNEESETKIADEENVVSMLASLGIEKEAVTFVDPNTSMQEVVMQSRFGIELWRYFALLAVLCAIIEMIVAREKSVKE